jgi:hypothetical protein
MTGAAFIRVEGSTNSTRWSGSALKDMWLRDILAVKKKLAWMTRELTSLKNNKTKASKK